MAARVIMSAVTALIWIIWLYLITSRLRRQRRTKMLIHMSSARDLPARMLVGNLGLESVYIPAVMLTMRIRQGKEVTSVANWVTIDREQDDPNRNTTHQGPLKSDEVFELEAFLNWCTAQARAAPA